MLACMKPCYCTKCKKLVPANDVLTHRQSCGPDADLTLSPGWGAKAKGGLTGTLKLIFVILLIGGTLLAGHFSFVSLARMRGLERIPATVIQAVLPGEVNLTGTARQAGQLLHAPHTGTPSVYYYYHEEREERDSDGDTRWVTVRRETRYVDFRLEDETGSLMLRTSNRVDFQVARSYRRTSGGRRYTEHRIEPGDQVFTFGFVRPTAAGEFEVSYDAEGDYTPIISTDGETRVRLRMAVRSIFLCWLGLVLLAAGLAFLSGMLRIHRVLVYFSLLNTCVVIYLVVLGLRMMHMDLQGARSRMLRHEDTARTEIQTTLQAAGATWDGRWESLEHLENPSRPWGDLTPQEAERLERIRLDLARAVNRVRLQRSAFPERWLAPLWGIPRPPALPVPDEVAEILAADGRGFEKARIHGGIGLFIMIGAGVVGVMAFIWGFRRIRFKRCMENIPTSPTLGAAYGLTELKGHVVLQAHEKPLKGPLSHQPCVQYHYHVKERRGSGKKSSWVTVINEHRAHPFWCQDAEGKLFVNPQGAEIFSVHKSSRRLGNRSYSETRLEVGDPLYAIGECVIEPNRGDRLYMRKPEEKVPFILGNLTEGQIMLRVAASGIHMLNASFAAILLMGLLLFGLTGSFGPTDYLAAALFGPLFMSVTTLALHYNDLVFLRQRASRNWSNIDVSLKKRVDLVPRLEEIAKGFREHERDVQEAVTDLRNLYAPGVTRNPDAVGEYMGQEASLLGRLMIRVENHPELRAQPVFANFARTLILLENEIALMRKGYNDAVERYNTRIESFPDVLFARWFGFKARKFLMAESDVIRVPPDMQALWEREQIEKRKQEMPAVEDAAPAATALGKKAPPPVSTAVGMVPAAGHGERVASDTVPDLLQAEAGLYALLLDEAEEVQARQWALLEEKVPDLVAAVKARAEDDAAGLREDARLVKAESFYPALRGLSPDGYRDFREVVVSLMEADDHISLFEYALHKSLDHNLDAHFGMETDRPLRHRDFRMIVDQVSILLSRLAWAESQPEDAAEAAFAEGVRNMNHRPLEDFKMVGQGSCTLEAFDEALEEVAHATPMLKANVLFAAQAAVMANKVYSMDQCMLLAAIADTLKCNRPAITQAK